MYCRNCGEQIDDQAVICPHCGVPTHHMNQQTGSKTNTLAVVGFILSFFVALAGLICSIIGRKQCLERNEGGAGLALAGIIISAISIGISVIYIIVALGLFSSIASSAFMGIMMYGM